MRLAPMLGRYAISDLSHTYILDLDSKIDNLIIRVNRTCKMLLANKDLSSYRTLVTSYEHLLNIKKNIRGLLFTINRKSEDQ
jgi:hypothetical protein